MSTVILFGTESGNSEFVAGNVADGLPAVSRVEDLAQFPVADFSPDDLYLIICSTYGTGDPPASARPFMAALDREKPNMTGVRFAVFGLGDSSYFESYSRGSEVVAEKLATLGATRVGEYGRHDASGLDDASDLAVTWAENVLQSVEA